MTARIYSNTAVQTSLVSGITAAATSLVVSDSTGYPAAPFAIVVDAGSATYEEVMLVTAKSGTTFTVTRAYDGTTAKVHAAGALVIHAAIADDFRGMQLGTRDVSSAAPAASDILTWNNGLAQWEPGAAPASGVTAVTATTPLASSGGATPNISITNQAANIVLAGPAAGVAAAPSFRALVAADLPNTAVTPGSYTNANITVDAQGRLTAAANGSAGGVTSVTASAPLASSGGATPDISFTGILAPANGGTGTANSGNLAWPAGGGTAALLSTSNLFTVRQDIRASGSGLAAGMYVPWITGDTLRTMRVGAATAGNNQIAIHALSNSATALLVSSVSGRGISTSSTDEYGIDALSTNTNAVNAVSTNGTAISATGVGGMLLNATTGAPMDCIATPTITTGVSNVLRMRVRSSGTPAATFGGRLLWQLESSTTNDRDAFTLDVTWVTATDASRAARAVFSLFDTATRECLRLEASGSAAMVGFLGATASAREAVTGSRGGNAALADLLTKLATKGLITDSTSA